MAKLNKHSLLNLAGIIIVIYLSTLSVQTISKNYELKKQIDAMQLQINQLEGERDELSYLIRYYQTDAYKEKEARTKLGLQQPGENVLIIPKHPSEAEKAEAAKKNVKPKSNFEQWVEFLFG